MMEQEQVAEAKTEMALRAMALPAPVAVCTAFAVVVGSAAASLAVGIVVATAEHVETAGRVGEQVAREDLAADSAMVVGMAAARAEVRGVVGLMEAEIVEAKKEAREANMVVEVREEE